MSSNLKVNNILPSTGTTVAVSGIASVTSSVSIASSCTATTYYGDGSNLTGIDSTQIVTGNTSVQTVDTGSDGHVKITTEGGERVRITNDGKVGINRSSPLAALDVESATDQTVLRLRNNGGNNTRLLFANKTAGLAEIFYQGDFRFVDDENSDAERLRITSAGKVNIGDTQMSQNIFNIEDGTAAALDIASHGSGGDTAYIGVKKSDGGGLTIGISNRDIIFKTGATYSNGTVFDSGNEKVRITSAGNMGVGTNSPDRKLDVSGTGNVYGKFQSTNTTGAGIEVKDISEDWLIQADGGSLDGLAFYDLGRTSYRFIMGNAGQFGVGNGSGRYGLTRQALVSGGGAAAPSWSSNPFLLDMDSLGDIDYDGVFLRYREVNVSGNGLVYLGLCKSTTNCPAGRIGCPVGYIPGVAYNSQFRVDKVGITPWPDGSGHRYEYFAIISDYVSAGKLGIFYLTNSTN